MRVAVMMMWGAMCVLMSLTVQAQEYEQQALSLDGGMMTECTLHNPDSSAYDPQSPRTETVPGHDVGGYWKTTLGLLKLDQLGPAVEGPYNGSSYLRGGQLGKQVRGQWLEISDDGERKGGTFEWTLYNQDRCFKGWYSWKDGLDEWYGMRIPPDSNGEDYGLLTGQSQHAQMQLGGQFFYGVPRLLGPSVQSGVPVEPGIGP